MARSGGGTGGGGTVVGAMLDLVLAHLSIDSE